MSHANGWVSHKGEVVGHFLYDGTNDLARCRIHATLPEAWDTRRDGVPEPECKCGAAPVPVELRCDYGGGFGWESEACLACRVITGYRSPWAQSEALGRENRHWW